MRPVPINQRRHPKVDLPLDIEMPVFIAHRHLLSFDFPGELMRAADTQAFVPSSFPLANFKHSFALL
jgi:hypothetical protein